MQLLIAFTCGLICLSQVFAAPPTAVYDESIENRVNKCAEQAGLDLNVYRNSTPGKSLVDEKVHCFNACLMQDLGLMNEVGDFNMEMVIENIPDVPQREGMIEIYKLCYKKKGDNPCAIAALVYECLIDNEVEKLFPLHNE